jgi:hypothetical protein
LKLGAADGFFQRPETPMVTVIGPLLDPRPLPCKPLPFHQFGSNYYWWDQAMAAKAPVDRRATHEVPGVSGIENAERRSLLGVEGNNDVSTEDS